MCSILQRTKKISKAVVSWGFHKPVCYHILIKTAPLCLHSSIWCEAVAQRAQQKRLQTPNHSVSLTVHYSFIPETSFKSSNRSLCHSLIHFGGHLRPIAQNSNRAQRDGISSRGQIILYFLWPIPNNGHRVGTGNAGS